jgi:hypothetical protein
MGIMFAFRTPSKYLVHYLFKFTLLSNHYKVLGDLFLLNPFNDYMDFYFRCNEVSHLPSMVGSCKESLSTLD